jgi:hypothetical protein
VADSSLGCKILDNWPHLVGLKENNYNKYGFPEAPQKA